MIFCGIAIGVIVGAVIIYFLLKPKLQKTAQYNKEIEDKNIRLSKEYFELQEKRNNVLSDYNFLQIKKDEIVNSIQFLESQAQQSADHFLKDKMEIASLNFENAEKELKKHFDEEKERYKIDLLELQKESANFFQEKINRKLEELEEVESALAALRSKTEAAIEAYKREEEIKLEEDKYKIILSSEDLKEISQLKSVIPYLRNSRPVCKIIWEGYYRTPTTELLGRIIDDDSSPTGIYRIVNLSNNMSYIGQAVNLKDRLKQHIKCGLGIDATNNRLYTVMQEDGVENFRFEILENCKREELNEREKYWIDFYQTQVWGYNMTSGGARN